MRTLIGIRRLILAATMLLVTIPAQPGQAATFWDWLWGRSPYYQHTRYGSVPAGYGQVPVWTPAVQPAATTTQPVTCCSPNSPAIQGTAIQGTAIQGTAIQGGVTPGTAAATVNCRPVGAVAGQPCYPAGTYQPGFQPVTVAYAPRYRSSWLRVPVTSYRPVLVMDPVTGGTVSQLQPCSAYTWQARRVPAAGYRSIFAWLHPRRFTAVNPTVVAQPATAACSPCAPGAVPSAIVPSTISPSTAVPSTGAPTPYYGTPSTQSPLSPMPSIQSTPGNPSEPASRPPTLQPNEVPRGGPTGGARVDDGGRAPSLSGMTRGARSPAASQPPNRVAPIPDRPNRPSESGDPPRIRAPRLLDPQDQTAHRNRRRVTPISWEAASPAEPSRGVPSPRGTKAPGKTWDDGGWKSTRGSRPAPRSSWRSGR